MMAEADAGSYPQCKTALQNVLHGNERRLMFSIFALNCGIVSPFFLPL